MSKPENIFISAVHRHLPSTLHREKMNNPFSSGTPDVYYSGVAADLWAEYKFVPKLPVRARLVPALSALQLKWCTERRAEGRHVLVIVGSPAGGVILADPESWRDGVEASSLPVLSRPALAEAIAAHCLQGASLCLSSSPS